MSPVVQKFYNYVKDKGIKYPVPDFSLKHNNWTAEEIQELITEFRKNNPKHLYKDGECPQCGSSVDCSESNFDNQTFHCDCGKTLKGHESMNQTITFDIN